MRRITQEEFDNVCFGNHTDTIRDCIIGEDIVLPKEIGHVQFINCVFETFIENVEFFSCCFDKVEWSAYNTIYYKDKTIFHNCKFRGTEFTHCNTQSGEFHNCTFTGSNFAFCVLTDSVFIKCDLKYSRIRCSDLRGIKIVDTTSDGILLDYCDLSKCTIFDSNIDIPQTVPSDGSFIAWKKAVIDTDLHGELNTEYVLVKLRIPEDAKRVGITNKCRADKVEVLGFETLSGEKLPDDTDAHSWYDTNFHYKIGIVEPDWFYDKQTAVCGGGIHFFLNKTDAVNYMFT